VHDDVLYAETKFFFLFDQTINLRFFIKLLSPCGLRFVQTSLNLYDNRTVINTSYYLNIIHVYLYIIINVDFFIIWRIYSFNVLLIVAEKRMRGNLQSKYVKCKNQNVQCVYLNWVKLYIRKAHPNPSSRAWDTAVTSNSERIHNIKWYLILMYYSFEKSLISVCSVAYKRSPF